MPITFQHCSFPISHPMLHSSPSNLEYIIVNISSLPDFSPLFCLWAHFLLDTSRVPMTTSCAALTLLSCLHRAPGQLLCLLPSFSASRWAPSAATVVSNQAWNLSQAALFCFLSCWPPAALVLQAGLSQCLHRGSVTCWSCSARLLFESAQHF